MSRTNQNLQIENIKNLIFTIRGAQVMMDSDLAIIYGVELKRLNEQVKRNIERFPENYRFQLTKTEFEDLRSQKSNPNLSNNNLKSQIATSSGHGGRRTLPYAFTEQGVSMLSAVLRSATAIKVSIHIMDAFVKMRKFLASNAAIFHRLEQVEIKQIKTDIKIEKVFTALEEKSIKPRQGIFYNGQIFDAYAFVSDLIRQAKFSILLVDNFIDDTVFTILSKRSDKVSAVVYSKNINKQLELDLKKHNSQYPEITLHNFQNAHDRFLIIDEKELYHLGASLKDLGKKWFAFSRMDSLLPDLLTRLTQLGYFKM